MCTQRMLISVLISGLFAFAMEPAASADVAMIPDAQAAGSFNMDRDGSVRYGLTCRQPIPHQIRNNPAPGMRSRAYLDSSRPDPGWGLPPGELNMPNIVALVRIPLDRTVRHPLTPITDPLPNNPC